MDYYDGLLWLRWYGLDRDDPGLNYYNWNNRWADYTGSVGCTPDEWKYKIKWFPFLVGQTGRDVVQARYSIGEIIHDELPQILS